MDKRVEELVKLYEDAQNNILDIISRKASGGSPASYQRALLKEINKELARLQEKSVEWIELKIPAQYDAAMKKAEDNLQSWFNYAKRKGIKPYAYSYEDITRLNRGAIEAIVDQKIGEASIANAALKENIRKTLTQKIATGQTIRETQKKLVEQIFGSSGTGKVTINGRNYDPKAYSNMLARTSIREATNTATAQAGANVGSHILEMSVHFPTCPICDPLQGRWYSTDPNDKRYPYIYDTAWSGGYNTVHPGCEHIFTVVILELQSPDELAKQTAFSNRPIDTPLQSKKMLGRYYDDQKKKAIKWQDRKQYERYLSRLGKDEAPKTFSAFRSMKRSNNDNWKELYLKYVRSGKEIIK